MTSLARGSSDALAVPAAPGEKWAIFFALLAWLMAPYFALQHFPIFPAHVMPLTTVDRAVPLFQPAIYIYVSAYFLSALPLLLVRDARTMRRMAFGFAWIAAVSHLCFLMWPTMIPSLVAPAQVTNPLLRWVGAVDSGRNVCPSLHASLAIYCALCCGRLLKSRGVQAGIWVWAIFICAATLLTKQHVALDVLAGCALGCAAYAALFRSHRTEAAKSLAPEPTLAARADLLCGREAEFKAIAALDGRKRVREMLFFSLLGTTGIWLALTSWNALGEGAWRWLLVVCGWTATALALNAFVLLLHEGMHGILFAGRGWNGAASVALGATFGMSFTAYRVVHARHHKFLGDSRDPDDYHNYVRNSAAVWALHFVRLAVGSLLYLALIPLLALKHASGRERRRILAEYSMLAALYSVVWRFVPATLLAVTWLAPLLIVGTMTAVRGFSQHGITNVKDPYLASRTILPHPAVRFLLLNENYHLEHHLFPEVPSYHLPKLHRTVWPQLPRAVSGRGYLRFLAQFLRATPRMDPAPIGLENRAVRMP